VPVVIRLFWLHQHHRTVQYAHQLLSRSAIAFRLAAGAANAEREAPTIARAPQAGLTAMAHMRLKFR